MKGTNSNPSSVSITLAAPAIIDITPRRSQYGKELGKCLHSPSFCCIFGAVKICCHKEAQSLVCWQVSAAEVTKTGPLYHLRVRSTMGCDVRLVTFRLKRLGANGQTAKGKQSYAPGRLTIRPEAFSVLSRFNHPYEYIFSLVG